MNEETQTKISKITIGRLHNLGNYEHIRYEISVDIGNNDNPAEILQKLETTLNDLQARCDHSSYDLKRAKEALSKSASELDKYELANLETYKKWINDLDEARNRRAKAKQTLAKLGGSAEYTDAKVNWEDINLSGCASAPVRSAGS